MIDLLIEDSSVAVADRPARAVALANPCCPECQGFGQHWSPADRRVVLCQCVIDVLDAEYMAGMEAARDEADYKHYHY